MTVIRQHIPQCITIFLNGLTNKNNVGIYTGSKVPFILKDSIYKAVKTGNYLNVSDFVRDAIKEKLQREGFLGINAGENKDEKSL